MVTAITATQKTILGVFGIEEGTILAKAVLVMLLLQRQRMKMARIKNMKTIDLKIAENEEKLRKLKERCR